MSVLVGTVLVGASAAAASADDAVAKRSSKAITKSKGDTRGDAGKSRTARSAGRKVG